jgi:hypothetical protein
MVAPAQQLRLWLDKYPDSPYLNIPRYELESVLIRLAALEDASPGDCLECGRQSSVPTPRQYMQQFDRANTAEETLQDIRSVVASILALLAPYARRAPDELDVPSVL